MTAADKTASKRRAVADVESELAAFREQVRQEAIRVAKDQGWCDTGLNGTLRNLGLPEKREYAVPMDLTMRTTQTVNVTNATSFADAVEKVRSGEFQSAYGAGVESWFSANYGDSATYVSHTAREFRPPGKCQVGDVDVTYPEREEFRNHPDEVRRTRHTCDRAFRSEQHGHVYCTRPRNHDADQHAVGNGLTIREVWPVSEQCPVMASERYKLSTPELEGDPLYAIV